MRRFLETPEAMEQWLRKEGEAIQAAGGFFRHWLHSGARGFGLVIVGDIHSGEFHLDPDGGMTANVDWFDHRSGKVEVLWTERRRSPDMSGFEEFYAVFSHKVTANRS